jgi:hypothetical protein
MAIVLGVFVEGSKTQLLIAVDMIWLGGCRFLMQSVQTSRRSNSGIERRHAAQELQKTFVYKEGKKKEKSKKKRERKKASKRAKKRHKISLYTLPLSSPTIVHLPFAYQTLPYTTPPTRVTAPDNYICFPTTISDSRHNMKTIVLEWKVQCTMGVCSGPS